MISGTVKWFSSDIGYGFIAPDDGAVDVLVHESALNCTSLRSLRQGQKVYFSITSHRGKRAASDVKGHA